MSNNQLPADVLKRIDSDANDYIGTKEAEFSQRSFNAYIAGATAEVERAQIIIKAIEQIIKSTVPLDGMKMLAWTDMVKNICQTALHQWKEGKEVGKHEGSVFSEPAPGITLGCISPEARELLDTIMEAWEKHFAGMKEMHGDAMPETTFYGFAYWLLRWSGLIQPALTNPPK